VKRGPFVFRDTFASPLGRETLRAVLLFLAVLLALAAIGGELAFRELRLNVLRERLALGSREAATIAREVMELRPGGRPLDDDWLLLNRDWIRHLIHSRIRQSPYVHHVEVRDNSGAPILRVPGREVRRRMAAAGSGLPEEWPKLDEDIIRLPLRDRESRLRGELRLAVSQAALSAELEELRRSLWIKIAGAGVLALMLLAVAVLYVLHLLRKNRLLEQARQSAARASYVGLLASGLAHEIRNPLNAMNMNLQMLEEELAASPERIDPEHAELLESTKSEIKRLERLVNNFLAYARPAAPRFENGDLNAVVKDVLRLLEADFRQSRVTLRPDLEPLLPHVETDDTQLKQALINLLVNARQVLKDGGTVTVRTRAGVHGEIVIEVEDDGPGIPAEFRERIFEVFYSSRGGGTGLGLPIARQIVERHGGTIEVDSVEGRGTTFRMRLPRHQRRAAAAEGRGKARA
jgi:signal transduction histidine kinase